MNEDLEEEIVSVNAIYEADVLSKSSTGAVLLDVPGAQVKLRVNIPTNYPATRPTIEGPEASDASLKKGQASIFAQQAQAALERTFREGEPCMFGLVEELKENVLSHDNDITEHEPKHNDASEELSQEQAILEETGGSRSGPLLATAPQWTLSDAVTEKKSVFIARAVRVFDTSTAHNSVQHLLTTDKKAAKATHNMTAWRIKNEQTGVVYRDCDDDGETAAGSRLLHLLELMNVWNVMVVVTRWYGGVHLGPDRFRIINSVARDAIVKAGLVGEHQKSSGDAPGKKR